MTMKLCICAWAAAFALTTSVFAETFSYDGEGRLSSVELAGDTVTVSDAVTIADGATVSGYGSLAFTGATTTEGLLKISADQGRAVLTGPDTLLDTNFATVLKGADLDSLAPDSATMGGASANGSGEPYNVVRGPGWMEVQFQNKPSTANKVVKARFEQSGADVVGKVLWAGYSNSLHKGADFDLLPYTSSTVATETNPKGAYGIKSIKFVRTATLSVSFEGQTTLGGVVSNANAGVCVTMKGPAPDSGATGGTGQFHLGSRSLLQLLDPHGFVIQNSLAGSFCGISVETDGSVSNPSTNFFYDVLGEKSWTVVAANASLASVTNVTAFLGGSSFNASGVAGKMYHFSNDGRTLTCQFQNSTHRDWSGHDDYLIKGVLLELRQNGSDIEGRTPAARYFYSETGAPNPIGMDIMQPNCQTGSVATSATGNGYCLMKTTLLFDRPLASAAGIRANKIARGTMTARGTPSAPASLRIDSAYGLSTYGEADILENAEMVLNANGLNETSGIANGGDFNLRVHPGGTLKQSGSNVFGTKLLVSVDGGELALGYGRTDDGSCHAYLPKLFLRNGARVTGLPPCVGKLLEEGVWKVYGSSPSVCSNGVILVGTAEGAAFDSKWVLDVADTGSGGAADFTLCGDVTHENPSANPRIEVEKRGVGVVEHDGAWLAPTRRVVKDGTWRFAANGTNAAADIALEGGGLEFAAGTTNVLGRLSVSAPATLAFEAGARVEFSDSAAEAWSLPAGGVVNITGTLDSCSLRFGTSKTLGSKVRALRFNGMKVHQSSDGYILPGPEGVLMIVR